MNVELEYWKWLMEKPNQDSTVVNSRDSFESSYWITKQRWGKEIVRFRKEEPKKKPSYSEITFSNAPLWLCALCLLCSFRASDKKRNLARQKAEAQRRLYGHGSTKKLSSASSEWEKQRHTLERRREELVRQRCTAALYKLLFASLLPWTYPRLWN